MRLIDADRLLDYIGSLIDAIEGHHINEENSVEERMRISYLRALLAIYQHIKTKAPTVSVEYKDGWYKTSYTDIPPEPAYVVMKRLFESEHTSDKSDKKKILCKDCIHSELDGDKRVCPYWMGYDMASQGEWVTVRDDDYCSHGSNEE